MAKKIYDEKVKQDLQYFWISKNYSQPYFDRAKAWYRLYRSFRDANAYPWKNNIFVPITFTLVETSVGRMMENIYSAGRNVFDVIPTEAGDENITRQVSMALNFQANHIHTNLFFELMNYYKTCAQYGNAEIDVYPYYEKDGTYIRPYISSNHYWSIYRDPYAEFFSKAEYYVRRYYMYISQIQRLEEDYPDIYHDTKNIEGGSFLSDDHREAMKEIGLETEPGIYDKKTNRVEVLDVYRYDGHFRTIIGRHTCIRDTRDESDDPPYPYKFPAIDTKFIYLKDEAFGMSMIEVMEPLQEEINIIRNQRRDNVDLVINKLFKVNYMTDVNLDTVVSAPGNIIVSNNPDGIQEFPISDVTQSSYVEEDKVEHNAYQATGEHPYARGETPSRKETATGIVKLQQASLGRFSNNVRIMDFGCLRHLGYKMVLLMRKEMKQEMYERIIGEPDAGFYDIPEEEIIMQMDFSSVGAGLTSIKEIYSQQLMQMHQQLTGSPNVDAWNLDNLLVNAMMPRFSKVIMKDKRQMQAEMAAQAGTERGAIPPSGPANLPKALTANIGGLGR